MDTGLPSHPKMLALLSDPSPKRHQAAASVTFAICWSGLNGTDGHIPFAALPFIHATKTTAALLVKHGFWLPVEDGWRIHNFAVRQEMAVVTAVKREAQRVGALMGNCKRWHGESCGCWQDKAPVRK
jgi:hypothetical protein